MKVDRKHIKPVVVSCGYKLQDYYAIALLLLDLILRVKVFLGNNVKWIQCEILEWEENYTFLASIINADKENFSFRFVLYELRSIFFLL